MPPPQSLSASIWYLLGRNIESGLPAPGVASTSHERQPIVPTNTHFKYGVLSQQEESHLSEILHCANHQRLLSPHHMYALSGDDEWQLEQDHHPYRALHNCIIFQQAYNCGPAQRVHFKVYLHPKLLSSFH